MKRALEMDDLRPAFTATGREVFADLPIHRCFQSVLDGDGAAFDEKIARQRLVPNDARKGGDERRVLRGVNVGVGDLDLGGLEQVGLHGGLIEMRMVEADGLRRIKAIEVNQLASS